MLEMSTWDETPCTTSFVWQQIQYHSSAYSKIGSATKRGRESEGFVSLESSKEIIFETNFAEGEQNPLEEEEEVGNQASIN